MGFESEVEAGPALAGLGPALASLRSNFSRFRLFWQPKFVFSPAISGVWTGFSRFRMLFEKFVDLGRNLGGK
jgi:hypothetical protein